MALSVVNAVKGTGNTDSQTIATGTTFNVSAGNLLVALVQGYGNGTVRNVTGVTDGTNAMTLVGRVTEAGGSTNEIWYKQNASAKSNATFTATFAASTVGYRRILVWQISGAATTGALDTYTTKTKTNGTAQTCANITPAQADEILIAGFGEWATHASATGGSSFTISPAFTSLDDWVGAYRIVNSVTAYPNGTIVTVDSSSDNNYIAIMAAFKAAASGTTYNDSISFGASNGTADSHSATLGPTAALGAGLGTADAPARTFAGSVSLGNSAGTSDTPARTFSGSFSLGNSAGTGDAVARTFSGAFTLGNAAGTGDAAVAAVVGALTLGIIEGLTAARDAAEGAIYNESIGIAVGGATSAAGLLASALLASLGISEATTSTPNRTAAPSASLGISEGSTTAGKITGVPTASLGMTNDAAPTPRMTAARAASLGLSEGTSAALARLLTMAATFGSTEGSSAAVSVAQAGVVGLALGGAISAEALAVFDGPISLGIFAAELARALAPYIPSLLRQFNVQPVVRFFPVEQDRREFVVLKDPRSEVL